MDQTNNNLPAEPFFKRGDRVERERGYSPRQKSIYGTVVGYTRDGGYLKVLWDGTTRSQQVANAIRHLKHTNH